MKFLVKWLESKEDKESKELYEGLETYLEVEEQRGFQVKQSQVLSFLLRCVWKEKVLFLTGLCFLLIATGMALLEPRLLGWLIDKALVPKDSKALNLFAGLFFGALLVRVVTQFFQSYVFSILGQKVMQDLRMQVWRKLHSLTMSRLSTMPAGKLITRVTNDVSALSEMFSEGVVSVFGNIAMVFGIVASLLIINVKLGLITVSVLPILIGASIFFSKKLHTAYRSARSKLSGLTAFLSENIAGVREVNIFNKQQEHMEKFDLLNRWYASSQFASVKVFALFQPLITLLSGVSMALVIYFGGLLTSQNTIEVGMFVAVTAYVVNLFQPIREITDKWNIFLSGMTAAERIYSVLDWDVEPTADARGFQISRGDIEFKNVWFAYKGEEWVLKDFSIKIPYGTKVGIVGPTGAGKSSLVNLLLRFYSPQKGSITIDGVDIQKIEISTLRKFFGFVQQDVFLFSGTVSENLTFWDESIPLRGKEYLESVNVASNDVLNERGSNLSSGQKQVLSFLRGLHREPKIWILDEATSHMDNANEKLLQDLLDTFSNRQTSLVIAHRLATITHCDLILVLKRGELIEAGSHHGLMSSGGFYSELCKIEELKSSLSLS